MKIHIVLLQFMTPYGSLVGGTNVSEKHTASIFKATPIVKMEAVCSPEMLVSPTRLQYLKRTLKIKIRTLKI
jgi:hypothetical protein